MRFNNLKPCTPLRPVLPLKKERLEQSTVPRFLGSALHHILRQFALPWFLDSPIFMPFPDPCPRFLGFMQQPLLTSTASLHGPGSWTLPSSCLFLVLATAALAVVCVSPTLLLCHLGPSCSLLLSSKLMCCPFQDLASCLFGRFECVRHELVSEHR